MSKDLEQYPSYMHRNSDYQAFRAQPEREFPTQYNSKPQPRALGTPAETSFDARRTPEPTSRSIIAGADPGGAYYAQTTNQPRMQSPSFSPMHRNSDYQAFRAQPEHEFPTQYNSKPQPRALGTPAETSFDARRTPEPTSRSIIAGADPGGAYYAQAMNQPRMQSPSFSPMHRNSDYQAFRVQPERKFPTQYNSKPQPRALGTPAETSFDARRTPEPTSRSIIAGADPGGAYYAQAMNQPRMQSPSFSPVYRNSNFQGFRAQPEREYPMQYNYKPKPGDTPPRPTLKPAPSKGSQTLGTPVKTRFRARRTPDPKAGSSTDGSPVSATHHDPDKRLPGYFMRRNLGSAYYAQATNQPKPQSTSVSPVYRNSDYQAFRAQPEREYLTQYDFKPKSGATPPRPALKPAPSKGSITLGTSVETRFDPRRTSEPKAVTIIAGTPLYATNHGPGKRFPDFFILGRPGGAYDAQATNQPRLQSRTFSPVSPK